MLLPVVLPALLVRSPEVAAEPVLVVPALTREVWEPDVLWPGAAELESLPDVAPELMPVLPLAVLEPVLPLDAPPDPDCAEAARTPAHSATVRLVILEVFMAELR